MKNATTFLIFISSGIRAYDFPRIDGFRHTAEFADVPDHTGKPLGERYVYLGRELSVEEFNDAAAKIFDPSFPGEDRIFQPLALDPAIDAKRAAAKAEAQRLADEQAEAAAEAEREAELAQKNAELAAQLAAEKEEEEREAARKSKLAVEAHTRKLDAETAAKAKEDAAKEAKALAAPVARPVAPVAAADGPAPEFTLDGKNIMSGGVRVAGLFGDDKQLRVPSAHADLRPAIEAWLATNPQ